MRGWQAGTIRLALALGALLWLAGCYTGAPIAEADYGRSVTNNVAQQVVNPRASQDLTPAVGLAPKTEQNVLDKYDKSFKAEEKKGQELFKMTTGGY